MKEFVRDLNGRYVIVHCRVCGRGFRVYRPLWDCRGKLHAHMEDTHPGEVLSFIQEYALVEAAIDAVMSGVTR